MRWWSEIRVRMRALLGRDTMEQELEDEVAFHLEREAEKLEAEGLEPREARRLARVRFGGVDRHKEAAREAWGVRTVMELGADIRFALRQLRSRPGFSAVAALTLALGIGGTVALGSAAHGVLVEPLPVPAEDELRVFWSAYNWRGVEFDHVKERTPVFQEVAAWSNEGYSMRRDPGSPSSLISATVGSAELFEVLGTEPLLGRTFQPGDDRPGAEPVVVLAHGLWTRAFGADRGVVGERILLDGTPTTVVGVMPEGFYFPDPAFEAFVPLELDPEDGGYQGNGWLVLTGRLRDGAGPDDVAAGVDAITRALGERFTYPEQWDKTRNAHLVPLREYLVGDSRAPLLLLVGASALLLLLASANVAALLLTRSGDRTREMAVRAALGAGRGRLARQLLTESVVLSLVGGGLGVLLAVGFFRLLVDGLPLAPALRDTLGLETGALLAGLGGAAVLGGLVSLAPVRDLLGGGPSGLGTRGGTAAGGGPGSSRVQRALVFAEAAFAVVLVSGAALLVRSVDELRGIDPGLDPRGVLAVDVYLGPGETEAPEREAFFDEVLLEARALPGVESAGLINRVPVRDGGYQGPIGIQDRPELTDTNRPNVAFRTVSPGALEALDVAWVEGRSFDDGDRAGSLPVALVNETMARSLWPGKSALGRRIQATLAPGWFEVVGVVADVAVHDLVSPTPMAAYYPRAQTEASAAGGFLLVETEGDPTALAEPLRRLVGTTDARAAVGRVETMDQVLDAAMSDNLRLRFFLLLFAGVGLALGVVGIYGVVSYAVARRRAEFGLRMALGAEPSRLLAQVVRVGMLPVAGGVVAGVAGAALASRFLREVLFGVAPTDPAAYLTAALILLLTGLLAALVPAVRAARTDPVGALRAE